MTLPARWTRLPGPADFLAAVVRFLADGNTVFVGLPDNVPAEEVLGVAVADSISRDTVWRWDALRPTDPHACAPLDYIAQNFDETDAGDVVLWVDAVRCDALATVWERYARHFAGMVGAPRVCLAMNAARPDDDLNTGGIRRCLWRDFVTPTDSRVLTEGYLRVSEHTPNYVSLKSSLVATLSGADLAKAYDLSQLSLRDLLDTERSPQHLVWEAQIPVLFPVIERARRGYIEDERYNQLWRLPHQREDGKEVQDAEELEIGDLVYQAREIEALNSEVTRLEWLRQVRNALAHHKAVGWGTLNALVGRPFVNFSRQ